MKYHRNPRMHTLGNHGVGGLVHALLAPLATSIITRAAYVGWEPRAWLASGLEHHARIVDLGCGVGTSTVHVGVDASAEMVRMARVYHPNATFEQGDAETWGDEDACDAATLSFVLHEAPLAARRRLLHNAVRISRSMVCVMDVCPTYAPSATMLWGEPYLLEYQRHVDYDVRDVARRTGRTMARHVVVPGHVVLWMLAADAAELARTETQLGLSLSSHSKSAA